MTWTPKIIARPKLADVQMHRVSSASVDLAVSGGIRPVWPVDLAFDVHEPRDPLTGKWVSLIHSTRAENVPSILANGFRPGRGEGGYGVYFTPEGQGYEDREGAEFAKIKAKFYAKKTLVMGSAPADPGYQKYVEATQTNFERPDIPLAAQGYDSAEYHDPWGNTQFIVFDPSKIVLDPSTSTSGSRPERTMSLSTPIVSAQDGPRLMGLSNFGGKKAAPFRPGGKRRAKVLAAKTAVRKNAAKAALRKGK